MGRLNSKSRGGGSDYACGGCMPVSPIREFKLVQCDKASARPGPVPAQCQQPHCCWLELTPSQAVSLILSLFVCVWMLKCLDRSLLRVLMVHALNN